MRRFYSPLRYPGGKSAIFKFVSSLFHENRFLGMSYAEPYAGGSGLALQLLIEEYVDHIYINDLDKSIYAFWFSVLNHNEELCRWIEEVDVTVDNWKLYKEIYTEGDEKDLLQLAKATFFLNRTNVSGVIKGGMIGGYKQLGKYKIDARFNKKTLIERIQRIYKFKKRITLSNNDGIKFVKRMNKKDQNIFIYLDPPYYEKGSQLYLNSYVKNDHSKLAKLVNEIPNNWMVSYDNQDFILNLYEKKRRAIYQFSQCASNRVGDEVLIFSDQIKFNSSINHLKSPVVLDVLTSDSP